MDSSVRWILPQSDEQRREILQFLVPELKSYLPATSIEQIKAAAAKGKAERTSESIWYLADGLGGAVAKKSRVWA